MLKENFENIRSSTTFHAIMRNSYLVSCFLTEDMQNKSVWEYNFYSRDNKNVNTFFIKNNEIILKDTSTLLVKKDNPEELPIGNIRLNEKEAVAIIKYYLFNKYKDDQITKTIISIEMNKTPLWNITAIFKNLKIVNVKLLDNTSKVLEDHEISAFKK